MLSALRASGWVLLATGIVALALGVVFAVIWVVSPIDAYRSLSTEQLAEMGVRFGLPIGMAFGAVAGTLVGLDGKRPAADYVVAGATGGLLLFMALIQIFFARGELTLGGNWAFALAGALLGALFGRFRNNFWRVKS